MSDRSLHGIGVSGGVAVGPAVLVRPAPGVDPAETGSTDAEADAARVSKALEQVSDGLLARAETVDKEASEILRMTAKLATDKSLRKAVAKQLAMGVGVTKALHDAVDGYVAKLKQLGGYMAQRATDLHDVRDRAISRLRGFPEPGVPAMTEPGIIIAQDLAPAETAVLDPALVLGIVTAEGGQTSHTAILASGRGIPAVVRVDGLAGIESGTQVLLDGSKGEVIVVPTPDEVSAFQERAARRRSALGSASGPGRTADGHGVKLLANVGTVEEAEQAAILDLEGIGLFRTEFLFLNRLEPPSRQEQTAQYTRVLRAFEGRRVVIRTLDAGADKPLAFADLGEEENPALGRRGLRLSQLREELLDDQLAALAAAEAATGAELFVMAPMVATKQEGQWFADKARSSGLARVGIMIETPAAAITSGQVLQGLDFASIGTNDLTQYTMAADRMQGALAHLLTPWQPAVLQMVAAACKGGVVNDATIGVCGEAASDPLLALVLVGLGVSSLSMSTGKIPAVRVALACHSFTQCQELAKRAVEARTAQEARELVASIADPVILALTE